jgi:hypothetical protein
MDVVERHFGQAPIAVRREVEKAVEEIRVEFRGLATAAGLPIRGSLKTEKRRGNTTIRCGGYTELCRRIREAESEGVPHGMSLTEMSRLSGIPIAPKRLMEAPDPRILAALIKDEGGSLTQAMRETVSLPFRLGIGELHVATFAPWDRRFQFATETYRYKFHVPTKWFLASEVNIRRALAQLNVLS